jgi:hypothetical protein
MIANFRLERVRLTGCIPLAVEDGSARTSLSHIRQIVEENLQQAATISAAILPAAYGVRLELRLAG